MDGWVDGWTDPQTDCFPSHAQTLPLNLTQLERSYVQFSLNTSLRLAQASIKELWQHNIWYDMTGEQKVSDSSTNNQVTDRGQQSYLAQ